MEINKHDFTNTVTVTSENEEIRLKRLATLLGLTNPTVVPKGNGVIGDKDINLNGGLKFLNIHCDLAKESYYNGKRSGMISSLEVPVGRRLKGTIETYFPYSTCLLLGSVSVK